MSGINFFQLIVVLAILVVVGVPLFKKLPSRKWLTPQDPATEELKHLLVRKEEILLSIKELEFDTSTDKVSKEDSEAIRSKLEEEALRVIDRIDELEKQLKKSPKSSRPVDVA